MTRPFAFAVAAILLLTLGAILIVRRVTEPVPPGAAVTGSAAAPADAQVAGPGTPFQGDRTASGPAAATTVSGMGPGGVAPNPAPAPAALPADAEEYQRRPPSSRTLNRPNRPDRSNQPLSPDE